MIPLTYHEWQVLHNAALARRHTTGFKTAPDNLSAIVTNLQRRGLITPGYGELYELTRKGQLAHERLSSKYSTVA